MSILMFGMNVNAQKQNDDCIVKIIITIENVKDTSTMFLHESKNITPLNYKRVNHTLHYSLDPSRDYTLIFEDELAYKIYLIKTSSQCNNTLRLTVDMSSYDSMAIIWDEKKNTYMYNYFEE